MEHLKNLDIPELNISEEKPKRKGAIHKLGVIYTNITKILTSTLSKKEKAKKIRNILRNFGYLTGVVGIYQTVSGLKLNNPDISILEGEIDFSNVLEIGPTFWLQVAAILFTIRIIHKVLSTGIIFIKDLSSIWKTIKGIFEEKTNERVYSFDEYISLIVIS